MKKLAALALCFLLLLSDTVVLRAGAQSATVTTTVPDTHTVTVVADHATVYFNGTPGTSFAVERLSQPRFFIRAQGGYRIEAVLLNGEDVTNQLRAGWLTLAPVYEDKVLTVTTIFAPDLFNPHTGDGMPLQFWWLLLAVSAAMLLMLERYRRKHRI